MRWRGVAESRPARSLSQRSFGDGDLSRRVTLGDLAEAPSGDRTARTQHVGRDADLAGERFGERAEVDAEHELGQRRGDPVVVRARREEVRRGDPRAASVDRRGEPVVEGHEAEGREVGDPRHEAPRGHRDREGESGALVTRASRDVPRGVAHNNFERPPMRAAVDATAPAPCVDEHHAGGPIGLRALRSLCDRTRGARRSQRVERPPRRRPVGHRARGDPRALMHHHTERERERAPRGEDPGERARAHRDRSVTSCATGSITRYGVTRSPTTARISAPPRPTGP